MTLLVYLTLLKLYRGSTVLDSPTLYRGSTGLLDSPTLHHGSTGLLDSPTLHHGSTGLLDSPTLYHGSTGLLDSPTLYTVALHSTMALLVYFTLPWLYLSLADSTLFCLGSTLYSALPLLLDYLTLIDSTMHGSMLDSV